MKEFFDLISTSQDSSSRPWRKVLYKDLGVPDNYVDSSFLTEMQKNLFVRKYDYWSLVLSTGCVTQQVNAVAVFVMCFVFLQQHIIAPYFLNSILAAILYLGYVIASTTSYSSNDMKALITFCTAAFVLSPVLMSLTETISTDTIYAMAAVMLLAHLLTHNYQLSLSSDGVISFNAGIFAAVCLASRLPTLGSGYSLIVLSAFLFGMLPNLRLHLRSYFKPYVDLAMTFTYFVLAFVMVWSQTVTFAILLLCGFLFIVFLCPYLLISLQPLKNNLYGPWDEAVVAES